MMNWVQERPTTPGVYWHRRDLHDQPGEYEAVKIGSCEGESDIPIVRPDPAIGSLDSSGGEWYGPLSPTALRAAAGNPAGSKGNARIIVRLRHGGSFCVEWMIPEGDADILSGKLKELRAHGDSIPTHLRMKMSDLMHELVKFAIAPARDHA